MDDRERVEVASESALWTWLAAHHAQSQSVWLVTYKKAAGAGYVSRGQVLDALLAYGWIDGRRMVLDAQRTMQLIGPRRTLQWAQSYKDRADRLIAEGRMQQPGLVAIAAAKAAGQWSVMADVEALDVPDDLSAALVAAGAEAWFSGAAPSYRRNVLRWVKRAKTAPTRHKRVAQIAAHAARGEKVPQY